GRVWGGRARGPAAGRMIPRVGPDESAQERCRTSRRSRRGRRDGLPSHEVLSAGPAAEPRRSAAGGANRARAHTTMNAALPVDAAVSALLQVTLLAGVPFLGY